MSDIGLQGVPGMEAVTAVTHRPLSPSDLASFAELLSELLSAQLPLPNALRALAGDAKSGVLQSAIKKVATEVESGISFSDSLRRRNGIFPELFVRMVEQGQTVSDLNTTLLELVREYRSQARFREALWGQLIGPISTSIVFGIFVMLLIVINVPRVFGEVFRDLRIQMPLPTRVLFAIGEWAHQPQTWINTALLMALLALIFINLRRIPLLQRWVHLQLLAIPIISPYLRALLIGRFCRLLSILLKHRVPFEVAIGIVRESFTFHPMREAIAEVRSKVLQGTDAAGALAGNPLFPETLLLFIRGGQEHGKLDESLVRVADMYEERAQLLGVRLRFAIYLFCTLAIGLTALWAIVAALMPIFYIQEAIQKR